MKKHQVKSKFDAFRRQHSNFVDRLIYQNKKEFLDIHPDSPKAFKIIEDLESFSKISLLKRNLGKHLVALVQSKDSRPVRILEVCSGSGWLSLHLSQLLTRKKIQHHIVTSDLSPRFQRNQTEIEWCIADATNLPFEHASFDLVICAQALHHFSPEMVARVLSESCRVADDICFFDLRRTIFGFVLVLFVAPFYSKEFIRDGIKSHRRAYSIAEVNFILQSAQLPLKADRFLPVGMLIEK